MVLLLTADTPESVLPTILSRCEVLRLRPLALDELENELLRRGLPAERARLLARCTGGRMGAALRLEASPDLLERRGALLKDMFTLLGESHRFRFAYSEKMAKEQGQGRDNLREALLVWLSLWRDLMLCASGTQLPPANTDCEAEIERLAQAVGLDEARRCALAAERALAGLDANLNVRLLADVTLMDWPRV